MLHTKLPLLLAAFLTAGLAVGTTGCAHRIRSSRSYRVVQVPVYQKVNGIQLVPQWSLALGWTHAF